MKKLTFLYLILVLLIMPDSITSSKVSAQGSHKIIEYPAVASNIHLLETWIQSQINYGKMPGISIGIVYDGELIYQNGLGYADVDKKIPASVDTRYRIASQSKMFTALGIMILRDEGKLRLDDPVTKFLPWLNLKPVNESDPPITLFQLLTHSSGLSRDIGNHWNDFKFPDRNEFKALSSSKLKLIYSPYTVWKYSNNGYTLLGMVIEAASGRSYEDFIGEKILQPLQCQRPGSFMKKNIKLPWQLAMAEKK